MTACHSSPLSDGLSVLQSPSQVNADLAFGVCTVPADRAGSADHTNASTLAARRRLSVQPSRLLPSFLRKRSISSLALENAHNEKRLPSWSPSHFRAVKRVKEPSGRTLPCSGATSASTPESSKPVLPPTATSSETAARLACLISRDHIPTSAGSKILLSPIRFAAQLGKEEECSTVSEQSSVLTSNSTTLGQTPPKYLYYPLRNPSDGIGNVFDFDRKVPRRRLSYGEPLATPEPRPLHKATGSRELRRRAGWETDDDDNGSCFEETFKASIRPYYSEPVRNKPRLVLDLTEGETIEEARATTVISSPSKPKVISIASRRGPNTPSPPITPPSQAQRGQQTYPDTPPDTPSDAAGLGINTTEEAGHDLVFDKIKAIPTWDPTLRSLETPTPCSTDTVRQIPPTITPKNRPDTLRPLQTPAPQFSELTTWILTELEQSITGNPTYSLRLDSPVIQQIRLPAAQRRVPRFQPPPLPLSRYSTFKPLSSHPPTCTPSPSHQITTISPPKPPSTTTLTALHAIFPHSSPSLLSSLQAYYLALHHTSNIHLPSSPSPSPSISNSPSRCTTAAYSPLLSPEMSYIPSKARAMLGLQPSTPSRPLLPTSWLHPQSLTWRERIENLEVGLGKEVATLLEECCGGAETDGEPLMRAVGEVVRMGEALRV